MHMFFAYGSSTSIHKLILNMKHKDSTMTPSSPFLPLPPISIPPSHFSMQGFVPVNKSMR